MGALLQSDTQRKHPMDRMKKKLSAALVEWTLTRPLICDRLSVTRLIMLVSPAVVVTNVADRLADVEHLKTVEQVAARQTAQRLGDQERRARQPDCGTNPACRPCESALARR